MFKRIKKCGTISGDVEKNQFLHMALQIAVVYLMPSEKNLTIKFTQSSQ